MAHSSVDLLNNELLELSKLFPSAQLPPNCLVTLKAEFLEYESRAMLKAKMPVMKEWLNPMQGMQGGFITAAFDNVFGPLSYVAARTPCSSLNIHTNYIRAIKADDTLIITAHVVSRGMSAIHLSGEAVNDKGKLIATATSNMVIMKI